MSENIKVIKFTMITALITIIITLGISLNIKFMWFEIKYIPNDFLLAIFSGVFASTLVVLICEIQKYLLSKKQAEYMLYSYMTEILGGFITLRNSIELLIKNLQDLVNENMFDEFIERMKYQINLFYNVDYTTWSKKQSLFLATNDFILYCNDKIMKLLNDCKYFKVAIINERIKLLKNNKKDYTTSSNSTVSTLLTIYLKKFDEVIQKIEEYLIAVDY